MTFKWFWKAFLGQCSNIHDKGASEGKYAKILPKNRFNRDKDHVV